MLFANKTAAEKRAEFRDAISKGKLLMMPGAHSPIIARIIEEVGLSLIHI